MYCPSVVYTVSRLEGCHGNNRNGVVAIMMMVVVAIMVRLSWQ